ncbi:IS110 family transposase [Ktedonobacter sp. SOSP1-85]|uniref:IS110 family transposase n=1 Tax=Ktedonobacter sp. SOSP1-85 TaxID=2778367 RepID=UPI001915C465|nr:IS110 family transposase [Ktedonobacter sp. SOSP1-85]
METTPTASFVEGAEITYVCGIDIGSQSCSGCITRPNKSVVVKPTTFANAREGWNRWEERLSSLDAAPSQIVIGMEATSRYHENLYHELEQRGYQMRLLHPGQMHHFHQQRGLRAKTDRLDAMTIARALLSGEARVGYIPGEQVATYRELVRLHTQLSEEAARYENQIQALVVVLFPEFTQVFADPCGQTALAVLQAYPHAQAVAEAGPEAVYQVLRAVPAPHFGHPTAHQLMALAKESVSSGRVLSGRGRSLQILCDQLQHTQANLSRLEQELEELITTDPGTRGLQQMPELGPKTIAVLRAELGEVDRFACTDQAVAYAGMDIKIKESGLWKGKAKLSKRGSGLLRQMLYLAALRSISLQGSAFGAYYQHLVARGLEKMSALMAVMRKMVVVATHLMQTGEDYDPGKVWVEATSS